MNRKDGIVFRASVFCVLCFYIYIAFCVPYCHDDWDWGLSVGLDQWLNAVYNSRYVGSFFVVAMTRSELFKTGVMALTMLFIPVMLVKLSGHRDKTTVFIIANVLMLIMPKLMWQQTYGWVSAFANFVVPAPLLLFLILIMEKSTETVPRKYWLCLPLALALCLFSENLTVYAFFACAAFTVFCAVKNRRLEPFHLAMTAVLAVGTVVMFSSPMYDELMASGVAADGVRRLTVVRGVGIGEYISVWGERFFTVLFPAVFYHSPIAPSCACLALIAAALKRKTTGLTVLLSLVTAALNVCILLGIRGVLLWLGPCVLFLCMLGLIIISGGRTGRKLFFLFSVPAAMLPLVVADEIGPRLEFLPYVFFMCLAVCSMPEPERRGTGSCAFAASLTALALCAVFYTGIYAQIRSVTVDRMRAAAYAVERGDSRVLMRKDPTKYWWGRNPVSDERLVYFKEFYGIPEDMEVVFEK